MYRYFEFRILPVDLVFEFSFFFFLFLPPLWKVMTPTHQDTAETTHASRVLFLKCTTENGFTWRCIDMTQCCNFCISKLAAMCKRRSSFFPQKKSFYMLSICLDGKGMAAALSMWRARFSFNAMCIMQYVLQALLALAVQWYLFHLWFVQRLRKTVRM